MTTPTANAIPKSSVNVTDAGYQFATGKAPRGRGRWAFDLTSGPSAEPGTFWYVGHYSDAKRAAVAFAAARGFYSVEVAS